MASDPETLEVHAAVLLHQDPALLPKSLVRQMEADAVEESGPNAPIKEYVTFCFFFEDRDREALYMDDDPTCLIKQIDDFPTLEAARAYALEWVGPIGKEYSFHHIPGIYQTAFMKFANGYRADLDPLEMAWYLPPEGSVTLVRDFPPRLEPSPITPEPGRVSWAAMPPATVLEMYRQRGF
jgi:hypothetical protein